MSSMHPAILEICAFGVPDDKAGEAVKAFARLKANAEKQM